MKSAVCLGWDTALVNVYQHFRVTFPLYLQDVTLILTMEAINSFKVIIVYANLSSINLGLMKNVHIS